MQKLHSSFRSTCPFWPVLEIRSLRLAWPYFPSLLPMDTFNTRIKFIQGDLLSFAFVSFAEDLQQEPLSGSISDKCRQYKRNACYDAQRLPKTGQEKTQWDEDDSQNNPACLLNPSHILGNAHGYLFSLFPQLTAQPLPPLQGSVY